MKNISQIPAILSVLLVSAFGLSPSVAQEENDEIIELSPFEISTEDDSGYIAINSLTGTRTQAKLSEIPISIVAITEEVIVDTGVDSLEDILDYASSVVPSGEKTFDSTFDSRGFDAAIFRDGFRSQGFTDASTISRVEVAKGAQGVIYGISSPGGVINVINKKPLFEKNIGKFTLQGGTESYFRSVLDYTDVLGGENQFSYRFITAYQKNDGQAQYQEFEKKVLAPSIAWNLGEKVSFYARYERTDVNESPAGPGAYPLTRRRPEDTPPGEDARVLLPSVGPEYNWNGPGSYSNNSSRTFLAELTYEASDFFTYKLAYNTFSRDHKSLVRAGFLRPFVALPTLVRNRRGDTNTWGYRNDFLFDFEIGEVRNRFLVTQEIRRGDGSFRDRMNTNGSGVMTSYPNNVFPVPQHIIDREPFLRDGFQDPVAGNAVYPQDYLFAGALEGDFSEFNRDDITPSSGFGSNSAGVFNQMTMLDSRLFINGGLRWDEDLGDLGDDDPVTTDDITHQLGALYKATDQVSFFVNKSTNFVPQPGSMGRDGEVLGPQTGGGYDFGIKVNLHDNKVVGSIGYFDLTRENIARIIVIQDNLDTPEDETERFSALSGKEAVQGFEADLTISPGPNTQVLLSFSYLDSEVRSGAAPIGGTFTSIDIADVGNPIVGAAPYSGSFLIRHAFSEGALDGFSLGAGGIFFDDYRLEARADRIHWRAQGFSTYNLFAKYDFKVRETPMFVQLNVDNLFDKVVFERRGQWVSPLRAKLTYVVSF